MLLVQIEKGLPLLVSIFISIVFPLLIQDRVHKNAEEANIIVGETEEAKENRFRRFDYLLNWRDFIIAILTGIFVLLFSAAEKLESTTHTVCPLLFNIQLPNDIPLSRVASFVATWIIPVMLLAGLLLVNILKPRHVIPEGRGKYKYWVLTIILVIPWYVVSYAFLCSPDK